MWWLWLAERRDARSLQSGSPSMRKSELHYDLPPELVAQSPAETRDASRLLILSRSTGRIRHATFSRISDYLPAASLLVINDTRVVAAKLNARRGTGGSISGLFLREIETGTWEILLQGRGRLRVGDRLNLGEGKFTLQLQEREDRGIWRASITPPREAEQVLTEVGETPLPPYIRRKSPQAHDAPSDRERYQTIYASRAGAVAAPTAGLHFTDAVFASLKTHGIECVRVTLHVGLGTFAPIQANELAGHPMHAEWFELAASAANAINDARGKGRPIVAVGTTAARVLETCADESGRVRPQDGWTSIFIYPPYRFRAVDAMITNFHLPGSTLLAMIYAFAGRDIARRAYDEAIAERYRFYSYGDAMLIL